MSQVYVIPSYLKNDVFANSSGFRCFSPPFEHSIRAYGIYMDRDKAEINPEFLQIIPYIIIKSPPFSSDPFWLVGVRSDKQEEKRLHHKHSIGMGGHIELADSQSGDVIWNAMYRELFEEVGFPNGLISTRLVGYVYDDKDEVGRVHLGMVFIVETVPDIENLEPDKHTLKWMTLAEIQAIQNHMEGWSKILIGQLI
jgi:predicted NUDIX family phosphoesterase